MGIREVQKAERRNTILSKSLDLFISKGFKATKISDIAKSAKMSSGLFFHYFPNTENLYEELAMIGLTATKKIMENQTASALDFFEDMTRFLLSEIEKSTYTSKMFVLMNQALRSDDTPNSVKEIVLNVDTGLKLSRIIQRGQKEKTIKSGNPLALANVYLCCLSGLAEQKVTNMNMVLPDANWIIDMIKKH